MSRYIMIRRLRGPAFLLLVGIIALLNQSHLLSWGESWPLFLILLGVMLLAERAALATEGGYPPPYPGPQYTGGPYPGATPPGPGVAPYPPPAPGSAIVPAHTSDVGHEPNGGES